MDNDSCGIPKCCKIKQSKFTLTKLKPLKADERRFWYVVLTPTTVGINTILGQKDSTLQQNH